MNFVVVVHGGGASSIAKDRKERVRQGIIRAATAGYNILKEGGSAVDAVEGAVTVLEDDPEFNAGCGSVLNTNGEVEMDASIMSGKDLSSGAVSAVQCIANPIKLARLVMEKTPHCFLTDQGAAKFAAAMGIPTVPREQLITERNIKHLQKEKHEKCAQNPDQQNAQSPHVAGTRCIGRAGLDRTCEKSQLFMSATTWTLNMRIMSGFILTKTFKRLS